MNDDAFFRLSKVLTGEKHLDASLGAEFLRRLQVHYGAEITELLSAFQSQPETMPPEQALQSILKEDPNNTKVVEQRHRLARAIIWIWYTGQFSTLFEMPDGPQTPDQYSKGLLWAVIRAHAPGYTNAKFGAWAKLPPAA